MAQKIVTIATYYDNAIAGMDKSLLEAEGIPCYLENEHTFNAHFFYGIAAGGIKLQVLASDAPHAASILREQTQTPPFWTQDDENATETDDDLWCCPKCGCRDIEIKKTRRASMLLTFIFFRLPLAFMNDKCVCQSCGHKWNAD